MSGRCKACNKKLEDYEIVYRERVAVHGDEVSHIVPVGEWNDLCTECTDSLNDSSDDEHLDWLNEYVDPTAYTDFE